MKKLVMSIFAVMLLFLAACGDAGEENGEAPDGADEDAAPTEEEQTEQEEDESGTMTSEENEDEEAQVGDVVTSEAGESTLVSRTDDVGTFESGPIALTIEKANGVSMEVDDAYVDMFETDQLEYIQVDIEVENTTDDTINFYASQAVLTTDTGEQLEPDFLMSDHIDGEYFGAVNKSGTSFYILENSTAEEVESIRLIFSSPHDENFENAGDDIDIEIELNN